MHTNLDATKTVLLHCGYLTAARLYNFSAFCAWARSIAFVSGSSGTILATRGMFFKLVCKRPFSSLGILVEFVALGDERDKEDDFVDDPLLRLLRLRFAIAGDWFCIIGDGRGGG